MDRKQVLESIKAEYAVHGRATTRATRLYVENRISHSAYMRAANTGLKIYMANAPAVAQFDGLVKRAMEA